MTQRSSNSRWSPQGFWAAPLQSVASHGSASRLSPCGEEVKIRLNRYSMAKRFVFGIMDDTQNGVSSHG